MERADSYNDDAGVRARFLWRANYGAYIAQNIELENVPVKGDQIAFTPKWKAVLSAEYAHRVTDWANGFIQADLIYKSTITFDAAPDVGSTIGD